MSLPLINSVRSFLASHFMTVDDEWLSGCIEYLTESSSESYSDVNIRNMAREQWLLNDLKDICPGSLPANLKSQQKTTLDGRFVVQVNAAIDIGTPAYQQYMKLQKVNQENIEATTHFDDKVPSHRMIKLYITDGVQEVSAIEYKPMRNLSCDITPGCKALLKGPIECRRGVLLLTESNIEVLGGEVQEIAVSNSLAGLLSTKLSLPMPQESSTPNPSTVPRNSTVPTPHSIMPSRSDEPDTDLARPVAIVTSLQVASFADDDIDVDQLAALEAEMDIKDACSDNASIKSSTNNGKAITLPHVDRSERINLNPTIDIEGTNRHNSINNDRNTSNPNKRHLTEIDTNPEKRPKANTAEDYPDEDDIFEDEDYLKEMETTLEKVPQTIPQEPFIYIKQINDLPANKKSGRVFKVKAQIMKLLSKLSVGKDGWSLTCTIVDGTGTMDVEFTSNVLSKLVGFTPQEMNQLKKQMATKPELKEKAVLALQKAKDSLQVLYCIIELTMLETPKITNLTPFNDSHVHSLKKRSYAYRL